MNCKFCNAEVLEEHKFCPFCGKPLTAEDEEFLPASEDVAEEKMPAERVPAEEVPAEEMPAKKKSKILPLVLGIAGALIALGALSVVLLYALGVDLAPRPNDILKKDSYTVEADKAAGKADTVVATIGDRELSNIELQMYYREQVIGFIEYCGGYTSQVGMDYTQPLSEQTCYYDETMTWEQYLLDIAIQTWQERQQKVLMAQQAGHTLGQEWQAALDALPAELETQATDGGYDSVEAMLEAVIGPGCTQDVYVGYVEDAFISNEFYSSELERLAPSQEEIEAYFTENEAAYAESGITKTSGLVSDVRHILICPEGTTDEDGHTTYSDEAWADCYAKAESILDEWKAGEATQESFAALANTYSEDGGSNTTGGLYTGIAPGSNYVEGFLDWAVDMSRQVGDTGIVQTEFGYHIMYYVEGEAYWTYTAREDILAERADALMEDAAEKWTAEVTYRKIALPELVV